MSTYYYYKALDCNEYFELTSRSWYSYLEDLQVVLARSSTYKGFIETLKQQKTFEGFYDEGLEFITPENEKYFLQPLFNWAKKHKKTELIDDSELYDCAVREMCKDLGLEYKLLNWSDYSPEIEAAAAITHDIVDKYLKCVGSLLYDERIMADIGVDFGHALAELKAGATTWRKSHPDIKFKLEPDGIYWCNYGPMARLDCVDILAEDWSYEYR